MVWPTSSSVGVSPPLATGSVTSVDYVSYPAVTVSVPASTG